MRKQYHLRRSRNGFDAWDIDRLIDIAHDIPVTEMQLADIAEIDEPYWFQNDDDVPSCRAIVAHLRLIDSVDLSTPIIVSSEGRLMDGMHRVAKALMEGREVIMAKRFSITPEPDFTDVAPRDLVYDDD
jgi:hypothetical protein